MNSCVNISIPKSDMSFLKKLAKNMGWEIRAEEDIIIPGIEQGLKDIEEGNIQARGSRSATAPGQAPRQKHPNPQFKV